MKVHKRDKAHKKVLPFSRRTFIQTCASIGSNAHIAGFIRGDIFKGSSKTVCVPGLNCYSCPGAVGSCPVGAFQAVAGSKKYDFSFYISGIAIIFGTVFGRFICGISAVCAAVGFFIGMKFFKKHIKKANLV